MITTFEFISFSINRYLIAKCSYNYYINNDTFQFINRRWTDNRRWKENRQNESKTGSILWTKENQKIPSNPKKNQEVNQNRSQLHRV